ncbi:TetR family transcriptional regulator [Blastococcus sp. CT_GayMR20]|uniref:TetR/AcrR family transcriptional regulator n=1 Tax=Blastococcus sp. CT_GayMR20 TaxID=2559609 RepID=UPI0010749435|nr:TetR/AcrR family transcriptional regulator [Blastococcus sp. CT_GayMR20]TFV92568.1 TetR family transcriptional regulator [Blastococcus sp. CT_GayMR20]TFV92644.1 TetR family transcriptional regulator [Blastococcus sp. CT_GayMR20]
MADTGDWRMRRWETTHRRVYDVAMGLFREHGFERVSVGQIATAAEVSVPTFYAHYPSKEHLVMQLPSAEDMEALVAALPAELPLRERLKHAPAIWVSAWSLEEREATLARWRIIAATPALRTRAAEFERTTANLISDALRKQAGGALPPADAVVVQVFMAAFTAGVLAWADRDGERKLEELIDEAFEAL